MKYAWGMTLKQILKDYDYLNRTERQLKEMHDRIAGPGAFIHERDDVLGEFRINLQDELESQVGRLMFEEHRDFLDGIK